MSEAKPQTIAQRIRKDGMEFMPVNDPKYRTGYDDPRDYLPPELIAILNLHFLSQFER